MTDAVRRLLGRPGGDGDDGDGEGDGQKTGKSQDGPPTAPELAPGEVSLRSGASVSVVTLRVMLVVVGVLGALLLLYLLRELVLMLIVALIIAAAMHAPVQALERRGLPRVLAIVAAYGALLVVIAMAAVAIGGPLVAQAQELFDDLPAIVQDLRGQAVAFLDAIVGQGEGEGLIASLEQALAEMELAPLLQVPIQAVGVLANAIIIFFLSAFLVYERDRAHDWAIPLLPRRKRRPASRLARSVLQRLARFIHGQLLLMTFVGTGMTLALIVLGIPFALPLGLFAFIVEAVPMIGPWLAIIPAAAVAFTESPEQALILIVFWTVIQQIEGYVLTPAVMGKVQHVPPSVVLLSVLAGFQLFGFIGAVIAVPFVAAVAMVIEAVLVPARRQTLATGPPGRRDAAA
jgi:predicted PurR-regulated permease PerM